MRPVRTSRLLAPSPALPLEARLWTGLPPKMRRRVSKVVPTRREKVRGGNAQRIFEF